MIVDPSSEFDDFDVVADQSDMADAFPAEANEGKSRGKRKMVFFLILLLMAGLGGASAWFVFFAQKQNTIVNSPVPVVNNENETPIGDLPPSVSANSNEAAPASGDAVSHEGLDPAVAAQMGLGSKPADQAASAEVQQPAPEQTQEQAQEQVAIAPPVQQPSEQPAVDATASASPEAAATNGMPSPASPAADAAVTNEAPATETAADATVPAAPTEEKTADAATAMPTPAIAPDASVPADAQPSAQEKTTVAPQSTDQPQTTAQQTDQAAADADVPADPLTSAMPYAVYEPTEANIDVAAKKAAPADAAPAATDTTKPADAAASATPATTTTSAEAMPAPVTPAPAETMQAVDATATAAIVAAPADSDRVQQLEAQLQALTAQVQSVNEKAAVATTQPADNAQTAQLIEQLKAVTQRLDQVGQQVEALDQRTTTLATELQNSENSKPAATERVVEAPKRDVPKRTVAKAKPRPVKKPVQKAATSYPAATGGQRWELRSAQPGIAWLGRAGSGEMNSYSVGQGVPGLGTVQAVTQENGRWIVRTTGGTLRE